MNNRADHDATLRGVPLQRLAVRYRLIAAAPASAALLLIRIYQRFLSPVLPVVTLGQCACRFTPTCSHYAADAVRLYGVAAGTWLTLRRLLKCTPLHPGGFDPVPARRAPACRVVAPSFSPSTLPSP